MKRYKAVAQLGFILAAPAALQAAPIVDDFESYAVGAFPSAKWQDTGSNSPNGTLPPPAPSCTVGDTLDAFGQPTRALHLDNSWVGSASGIYCSVPSVSNYTVSMDVRTDAFGAGATDNASDWPWMMGVSRFDAGNQAGGWHSLQMYGTDMSHDFRAYAIADADYQDFPLGVAMQTAVWYRVQIDVDAISGSIRSRIWDAATSTQLADSTVQMPGWTAADSVFDVVTINQGELSAATSADVWVDNVTVGTPEPSSVAMLAIGGLLLARRARGGR